MKKPILFPIALLIIASLILGGCTSTPTSTTAATTAATPGGIPTNTPRGTVDPDILVDIYKPDKACDGTTLLPDNHDSTTSRIIEVNMLGEIIWQYAIPADLKRYTNPGFDVELLANNNILYILPGKGIYEIDRSGNLIWSYLDAKISHDADRLPNGNTLMVYGAEDQKSDAQVKEVDPTGKIVWSWYAKDYFDTAPYDSIYNQGWTHTNAVSRLANGNTLISPRNFNMVVEVGPDGHIVAKYGEGFFYSQHDPYMLPNGNILFAQQGKPHRAIEYNPTTGKVVWESPPFELSETPVRDANRLPNGNTLITASTKIVEVTPAGEIVWQMIIKGANYTTKEQASGLGFYKAERISAK